MRGSPDKWLSGDDIATMDEVEQVAFIKGHLSDVLLPY